MFTRLTSRAYWRKKNKPSVTKQRAVTAPEKTSVGGRRHVATHDNSSAAIPTGLAEDVQVEKRAKCPTASILLVWWKATQQWMSALLHSAFHLKWS
uniref:Uncharacterized protein n=1 Tax=Plectus sambesii TaxID=2011161 RepID=A0A914V7U2_9BILA